MGRMPTAGATHSSDTAVALTSDIVRFDGWSKGVADTKFELVSRCVRRKGVCDVKVCAV